MTDDLRAKIEKAESGNAAAMYDVGLHFYNQFTESRSPDDLNQLIKYWSMAGDEGDFNAIKNLAFAVYSKNGLRYDPDKCFEWIRKLAVDNDDPWGQVLLGGIYCGIDLGNLIGNLSDAFSDDWFKRNENKSEAVRLVNSAITRLEGGENKPADGVYFVVAFVNYKYNMISQNRAEYVKIPDLKKALDYLEKAWRYGATDDRSSAYREVYDTWHSQLKSTQSMADNAKTAITDCDKQISEISSATFISFSEKEDYIKRFNGIKNELKRQVEWFTTQSSPSEGNTIDFSSKIYKNYVSLCNDIIQICANEASKHINQTTSTPKPPISKNVIFLLYAVATASLLFGIVAYLRAPYYLYMGINLLSPLLFFVPYFILIYRLKAAGSKATLAILLIWSSYAVISSFNILGHGGNFPFGYNIGLWQHHFMNAQGEMVYRDQEVGYWGYHIRTIYMLIHGACTAAAALLSYNCKKN